MPLRFSATLVPHMRIPRVAYEDRDNFIRNLVTVVVGSGYAVLPTDVPLARTSIVSPLSRSAATRTAVLPLADVKAHLRIEPDQTAEDAYLTSLEMAARLHTENVLRRTVDATVGENVKVAMLLLIAHWYRSREAVATGTIATKQPLAYEALLFPERDYPCY